MPKCFQLIWISASSLQLHHSVGLAPLLVLEISWLFELFLKEGRGKGVPGTWKLHMYKDGSGFLEKQGKEGIAAWNDGKGRAELVGAREVTQDALSH